MNLKFFYAILFLTLPALVWAQEKEVSLRYNAEQAWKFNNARESALSNNRGGGMITLPFFDDFSRYSLPAMNEPVPADWQMWSDNMAFVNCTFPVAPLTIGVATLDGLQMNGMPYEWDEPDEARGCDTLTSLPMDLLGFTSEDSIRMLFHFENGGWGDTTETFDTLYLDFYTPLNSGVWFNVWKVAGGISSNQFQQVFLDILDPIYLQSGFKIRFRNYGRPGGSVDHWHLDYILIADQLNPTNFIFDEVGFQYCNNSILSNGYTSMPWTHFIDAPGNYMAEEIVLKQRNLGPTENITSVVKVKDSDGNILFQSQLDPNTSSNSFQEITRTISLNNFEYPNTGADFEEMFTVCGEFSQTDAHLQNDTMCFDQHFKNYYAYDDGSAERGYALNTSGSRAAMRFNCEKPDTLLGVYMHWLPYLNDHSDESFLLRVYTVNGTVPGTELNEDDLTFYTPQYNYEGYNQMYYYELSEPIALDGPFFVGWIHQSSSEIFIGNDKNTDNNTSKLYYQLNAFSPWIVSGIQGSIMLRPVFKNSNEMWVDVTENTLQSVQLFPNPVEDLLQVSLPDIQELMMIEVFDVAGRMVSQEQVFGATRHQLNTENWQNGYYMVRISVPSKGQKITLPVIKGQ